jgi:hypothetical protein
MMEAFVKAYWLYLRLRTVSLSAVKDAAAHHLELNLVQMVSTLLSQVLADSNRYGAWLLLRNPHELRGSATASFDITGLLPDLTGSSFSPSQ